MTFIWFWENVTSLLFPGVFSEHRCLNYRMLPDIKHQTRPEGFWPLAPIETPPQGTQWLFVFLWDLKLFRRLCGEMYWHCFNQAPVCCWRCWQCVFPQQCSLTCKNMLGESFLTRNKTSEGTNVFVSVLHQENWPGIYSLWYYHNLWVKVRHVLLLVIVCICFVFLHCTDFTTKKRTKFRENILIHMTFTSDYSLSTIKYSCPFGYIEQSAVYKAWSAMSLRHIFLSETTKLLEHC